MAPSFENSRCIILPRVPFCPGLPYGEGGQGGGRGYGDKGGGIGGGGGGIGGRGAESGVEGRNRG